MMYVCVRAPPLLAPFPSLAYPLLRTALGPREYGRVLCGCLPPRSSASTAHSWAGMLGPVLCGESLGEPVQDKTCLTQSPC